MRDVLIVLAWWVWAGWGVGLALALLRDLRNEEE
jgi:hypothetical protein